MEFCRPNFVLEIRKETRTPVCAHVNIYFECDINKKGDFYFQVTVTPVCVHPQFLNFHLNHIEKFQVDLQL